MNLSGVHVWSSSFHTLAVIASTAALDTMLEFAIGIRVEFGSRGILYGAGISVFAKRGERRRGAVVCLMGSDGNGMAPGVLFLVVRPCVRGAALMMRGSVGLLVVVIGGACITLSIVAPPSEVGTFSTLCGEEGRVAAIVFIAVAMVRSSFLFAVVGRRAIDVTSSSCTSMACSSCVKSGRRQCWG